MIFVRVAVHFAMWHMVVQMHLIQTSRVIWQKRLPTCLKYAVITSVDRDDLLDGGAQHFVDCIKEARALSPKTLLEILVPDFRGRMDIALRIMTECPPDVFNHNIETVPRLYKAMRPGSDYQHSLNLLKMFKDYCPEIPTKCGLMVGIGETEEEVLALLDDLKAHDVDYVTIGQYLQPSKQHAPIDRFVTPEEFERYAEHGRKLGFKNIWSAPMVRSATLRIVNTTANRFQKYAVKLIQRRKSLYRQLKLKMT